MKRPSPLLTVLALVAATGALWAGEPPSKFEAAVDAADANEATPAGSKFGSAVNVQFGKEVANKVACFDKEAQGKDPAKFDLVMKLDAAGYVVKALVYPETTVAKCVQAAVAHDLYPMPPHRDYWVRVSVETSRKPYLPPVN